MQLCAACKCVYYCSVPCQKSHWKSHKADCKASQQLLECLADPEKLKKNKHQKKLVLRIVERIFREAAQGFADAQFNAGLCFERGMGVAQDLKKAVKYYEQAAAQGVPEAQFNAGVCFHQGMGVTQDLKKAVKYYEQAAAQGFAKAQFNAGVCFEHGVGVAQDMKKAVKYYEQAAAQGHTQSQHQLEKLVIKH